MKTWMKNLLKGRRTEAADPLRSEPSLLGWMPAPALLFAEIFALRVAAQRRSDSLEPRDGLAGIYIASAEFDYLLRYWADRGSLERLIKAECGSLHPRLFYWVWLANRWEKQTGEFRWVYRKKISTELQRVRAFAYNFACRRNQGPGDGLVVLTEDILLALVRLESLPISRKLLETGLDLAWLEQCVERPSSG